jgi:NhaA family Na+:H+ antiporter
MHTEAVAGVIHCPARPFAPLTRLEKLLHEWSAFFILPLFALANAGVHLTGELLRAAVTEP